ncbi:MAG: S41 family peptidase, partial [Candidatus Aminicenantes bacterium]|nr:S41 family peptidase [Candidatus Aminicenantes bacterium]
MTSRRAAWNVSWFVIVVILTALGGRAQAPAAGQAASGLKPGPSYRENDEIPGPLRLQTFQFVWEKIRDEYFDPTFGAIDWNAVKEKYAPQVDATKTSGTFHSLLGRMLAELGRSHSGIMAPHQLTRELKNAPQDRMTLEGVVLRVVEGRISAYSVKQDSPAWQAGLRAGDVILKLADKPLATDEDVQKRPARALAGALRTLSGGPDTSAAQTILEESGREKTITVPRTTPFKDRANLGRAVLESRRVHPRVGYVWFDGWSFDLKSKLEPALKDLWDTDGLVIDLRQNRGGVNPGADFLAAELNADPGVLAVEISRNGERKEWAHAGGGAGAYPGRVAILVDEWSGSASEVFAAAMQES